MNPAIKECAITKLEVLAERLSLTAEEHNNDDDFDTAELLDPIETEVRAIIKLLRE
jgi:hypothetical protein